MELVTVKSSNLNAVGYDKSSMTLRVLFLEGSTYDYFNVPASVHGELMKSESVGEFFKDNVREQFKYTKVNLTKERNEMKKQSAAAKPVTQPQPATQPAAVAVAPAPTPVATVVAPAPATPSKQQVTIERLTVALREKRQIEVTPEMVKQDGKFILINIGPTWPTIQIGNSGGVTVVQLKSYASAFDAAIEGDTLLAKQVAREQKRAAATATPAPTPTPAPAAKETVTAKKGKQHEAVEQQLASA